MHVSACGAQGSSGSWCDSFCSETLQFGSRKSGLCSIHYYKSISYDFNNTFRLTLRNSKRGHSCYAEHSHGHAIYYYIKKSVQLNLL